MPLNRQSSSSHPAAPLPDAGARLVLPAHKLPDTGVGMDAAYELISSELLLDGQARLNLATFVTTWMPSSAPS